MGVAVTIDELFAFGLRQLQAGQATEAESTFRRILATSPNHAESLHLLGAIAAQRGQNEVALDLIGKAITLNSSVAEFHNSLGNVLFLLGRLDDAIKQYEEATVLKPGYAESHFNLANAFQATKRLEEAMTQYQKVLALNPNESDAAMNLGSLLAMQGKTAEAVTQFELVIRLSPQSAEGGNNLGHALAELGRLDEATMQFQRVLEQYPNQVEAEMNLGTVFARQGKLAAAVECFRHVLGAVPQSVEARNNLGNALAELGRLDEAIVQFRRAVAIKPDYAQAEWGLGNALQQLVKLDEAVEHFRLAVAKAPDYAKARVDLGLALVEQRKLAEARAEAERAALLANQPSFPHYLLGVLFARCGIAEAARIQFNLSLKDDPEDRQGARVSLAALGFEPMPERASSVLLDQFYDLRAAWWNREDVVMRPYRAATSLVEVFGRLVPEPEKLDILDAGCGAGLIWVLIRRQARALDGVDRSAGMLALAREKNIYRELHHGDLVQFMAERPERYDVITSGAVLLHFGDLKPVFVAAATTLRDGGLFLFTLFHNAADENAAAVGSFESGQAQTGSFVHGRDYLARIAASTGFQVEMMEREVFDQHAGTPRMGLVVALRRRVRQRP
jgi:predicted TPR repeat methyltransferase